MSGPDPHEAHRVATPLELLFYLTFVIAFGVAASQFAHSLASGHVESGLISFTFAAFSVCWAWINFSQFASAYVIQWLRGAAQDPARKSACLTYAATISVAQVGWIAIAVVNSSLASPSSCLR